MPTIDQLKEQETPPTPLFLFDCVLSTGAVERWSTHTVTVGSHSYSARLLQHNLFTLQGFSDGGLDVPQKIALTLANADSRFSQIERESGFKGARLTVQFVFFDLTAGTVESETRVIFRGVANPPEEITEAALRLSFTNRLNLQRIVLPEVRIERRCPWLFPATAGQRSEAMNGGVSGKYSALARCGYSADQAGGTGNLNGSSPYTSCDYTRNSCVARGMFDTDHLGTATRRFGGVEFMPAQIEVRSHGEKGTHLSPVLANSARYNDFVPLVYGTAWCKPPVIFARNDGNLTHMEVLLGMGEIEGVVKVVVNGIEIPEGQAGVNMTATGWFNVVTKGTRTGAFNQDFVDGSGNALGDPYGSMAVLSVVVPNQISSGQSLAKVEVLLNGLRLERFDAAGASLGEAFTNNPAWVLLDVLRRSGWTLPEIDIATFGATAVFCDEVIETTDLYGNAAAIARFQCNLAVQSRRSAAELIHGIRNGSSLLLNFGGDGRLRLRVEHTLAVQQPVKPAGSNSVETLDGGWPAYEFSDGSAAFSGLLRRPDGSPAVRLWSRSGADTPNRLAVEFQDEFNEFQHDSLALVDVDDSLLTAREVTAGFAAVGLPNFDQATRMLRLQLNKTIRGYTFIDFETSVRGVGLSPGDLITITYLKEGLIRKPFRVVKLAPGKDYETVAVTAQWHDDSWYTTGSASAMGGRRPDGTDAGIPKPLVGSLIDENGIAQFGITESQIEGAAGTAVGLAVEFVPPARPAATAAAIPVLSISPTIQSTGGALAGSQNLYYAVTGVDSGGAESGLSFVVRAKIPAGTNANTVTLSGLSFSTGTAAFHVYRGPNPSQMLRIAENVAVGSTYTDTGAAAILMGPPDGNYDHANFYWRRELYPEIAATIAGATTIGNSALGAVADEFKGKAVRISRGTGATQERVATGNDATTLMVSPPWTVIPDTTSYFTVADAAWNFGAVGASSPAQIQIPNWGGQTVEISGRSANAQDQESRYELNPLTRWQLGSGAEGGTDPGFPPLPDYSLTPTAQGTVELAGITFPGLTNTHTISAGTLTLFYWNELNNPSQVALGGTAAAEDTVITLSAASAAQENDFLQVDEELLQVVSVQNGGLQLEVTRGGHESTATAHDTGAAVYILDRKTVVVPFVRGFFGSPAGNSYTYSIFLPDARIAASEFLVTNIHGTSPVKHLSFAATPGHGLRTLSGGQIALQVEGYLAVKTDATPPFVMEDTLAVRDIFATVREAPSGGDVQLVVRHEAASYGTLTIPSGATVSNTFSGAGLPPLAANAQVHLDIVSVPTAANSLPGRDLTVTIRL